MSNSKQMQEMHRQGFLNAENFSDLRVMMSAAGYYVGTAELSTGFPGSRDSGYFPNEEEAEKWLQEYEAHLADPSLPEPTGLRISPM